MEEEFLEHYGTPRHSGRYPWGSGKNPQHNAHLLRRLNDLESKGLSEIEIATGLGFKTTNELRAARTIATAEVRLANIKQARALKEKGMSTTAIAKRMGLKASQESTVRGWLAEDAERKARSNMVVADALKSRVDKDGIIDIGRGAAQQLRVSDEKLNAAVTMLTLDGYNRYRFSFSRAANKDNKINMVVLAKPDITYGEAVKNRDKVKPVNDIWIEDGKTIRNIVPPRSVDSNRIFVKYREDGGEDRDGLIELRPGVDDISMGKDKYAQVRIAVDGNRYLKGMAIYSDNIPEGYDILVNSNKSKAKGFKAATKPMKTVDGKNVDESDADVDWTNPFGTNLKMQDGQVTGQHYYNDKEGKEQLSCVNIVNDDETWGNWSRNLPTQFLSKQDPKLAEKQLKLTYEDHIKEFNDIKELTNPVIKRELLESFADGCDSSAVHMKAKALPRQQTHVLLPVPELKDNEIYAPNYENGEEVTLVRYPHGGIFEMPVLRVNNTNRAAKKAIGTSDNAVGINPRVAGQLSGADFDGDTAIVIPTKGLHLRTSKLIDKNSPLQKLKYFNTSDEYPAYEGMIKVTSKNFNKQSEMGKIANLITDMQIAGASDDEIARATRHSMVIIDALKHNLDYKRSYQENGIQELALKYQGKKTGGASTLISKAKKDKFVPRRKPGIRRVDPITGKVSVQYYDPETGKKLYTETGETKTTEQYYEPHISEKTGKMIKGSPKPVTFKNKDYVEENNLPIKYITKPVMQKTTMLGDTDDAHTLSSGSIIEEVYAEHSNRMKMLANEARKEMLAVKPTEYNKTARVVYKKEYLELKDKLDTAKADAPNQRRAEAIVNKMMQQARYDNPDMDLDEEKKLRTQLLAGARARTGAGGKRVKDITDRQWEAIQSGAISNTMLKDLITYGDIEEFKELAMPRRQKELADSTKQKIRAFRAKGVGNAMIADALGLSVKTVKGVV